MTHIQKNIITAVLAVHFPVVFISCSDENTNINAEKMTFEELEKTPGYTWFSFEIDKYEPENNVVLDIKEKFDPSKHRFILFVKPSCSCPGKHLQSPGFVKTLENAGISIDKCEIFSMSSATNLHPYMDIIKINELPAIIVMKGDMPVYSVSDTVNKSLVYNPNASLKVEQALLLGLEK